jgi:hypothetical protein
MVFYHSNLKKAKSGYFQKEWLFLQSTGLLLMASLASPWALDITPKDIPAFMTACKDQNISPMPRQVDGNLVFNGPSSNPQLDAQIAVGGGVVLSATNTAVLLYSKKGEFLGGGRPSCLNGEIDPKTYFDPIGKRFIYASMAFSGQARIAISKTSDPRGGWWAYSIPVPGWVDGGAVGGNKNWITYSYPGNNGQRAFLMDRQKAESGLMVSTLDLPTGNDPGQPVFTYDETQENLYYVKLSGNSIQVKYANAAGELKTQPSVSHGLGLGYPTPFPQKGGSTCSAGDINAKNAVLRNGFIWTADAASSSAGGTNRTMARFYQLDLTGKLIQTGAIDDPKGLLFSGQVTVAVNKRNDLLLVFQQSGRDMFISSRMSYRLAGDPLGALRPMIKHAEGLGANSSTQAWGDYSGAIVDGDNDIDLWGTNSVASASGGANSVLFQLSLPGDVSASSLVKYFPDLSVQKIQGLLVIRGMGLDEKSQVEVFNLNGLSLAHKFFQKKNNGTGEAEIKTASLPAGPVYLSFRKTGYQERGQWLTIKH